MYDTEILEELPDYCGKCKVTFDRKKVTYFLTKPYLFTYLIIVKNYFL